jgi:hypothetical protein
MGYWLLTAPAFGLASTIALRNLRDPSAQFGGVRMWGTIGWMCVGWVVSLVMLSRGDGRGAFEAFGVSACLSAFLTVFALFLPDTPPAPAPAGEPRRRGWREVSAVLAQPSVGLLVAIAFGACLTTPFVYQVVPAYLRTLGLPRPWVPLAMSLGQVLEIGALLLLPRALRAFGFRGVMTFGLSAWILYHGLMAANPPLPLAIVGLPIQGLAIACFHIAGLMYLDTQAPSDGRAAMQGLYLTATAGCGSLLGSLFAGEVVARNGAVTAAVFRAPLLLNVVLIALFALAFRARPPRVTESHSVEEVERSADLSTCAKRVGRPRRRKRPQVVR